MIRNILGGFLFSGDDVYKSAGVLSGGERTRLAVARMLLRPSNTLLLDEPTNHLDLDSKDVLLDALEDYGGTLIFVSHDRYFVERLATKIVEVGGGDAVLFPGTYTEFLWRKEHPEQLHAQPTEPRGRRLPGGKDAAAHERRRARKAGAAGNPRGGPRGPQARARRAEAPRTRAAGPPIASRRSRESHRRSRADDS